MIKRFRPALGTRIVARAYVKKMHSPASDLNAGTRYDDVHTLWPLYEGRIEGVFMGYRTIKQGTNTYVGDPNIDGGRFFVAKLHFEAWLVIADPRRNPVYVLPDDVIEIDDVKLHETKFFLIGEAGQPNSGQMSIGKPPDSLEHKLKGYFDKFLESGWREVGWQEWFLAKEGHK